MADKIHLSTDQEQLVLSFAQTTNCDLDLAYCLLDQNDWQFNATLDIYTQMFSEEQPGPSGAPFHNNVELVEVKDESYDEVEALSDDGLFVDNVEIKLRVVSWNVDCLNEKLLKSRMIAMFNELRMKSADVVFLQEVIEPVLHSLYDVFLNHYQVYKAESDFGYFVVIMVKKSSFSDVSFKTIKYAISEMGRNLIRCDVSFLGLPLSFYTTHLESTKAVFNTRIAQMQQCVNEMRDNEVAQFKLLGGDLNIRDAELAKVTNMHTLRDAWIESGSPKEHQYTWDMSLNDNLENMAHTNAKCRFDRFFFCSKKHDVAPAFDDGTAPEANDRFQLAAFQLIGTERLGCGMFVSDHFGLMADFHLNLT